MKIRFGSRESKLAVIQSEMVIEAVKNFDENLETELVTMKTTGDKILDRTLDKVGGKGLFVKELEQALMDEAVDLTVHSLKDVTMDVSKDLPLLIFSKREDPRDALILPKGKDYIDFSKPIGCSSQRRILQLAKIFPEAEFKTIRGNVQTRLAKLDSGEFSATVLACAGLKRLGLADRISRIFEPEEILPAAGQGILAIQGRAGYDVRFLKDFENDEARYAAIAERSFVRTLDGGCSSPIAAYATVEKRELTLTGFYVDEAGNQFLKTVKGDAKTGEAMGKALAEELKSKGIGEE